MLIKKIINSIWNEFIYGGHLTSLGAVSIVFVSSVLLGINITWDCLVIVYIGFQSMYLYNRYKELDQDIATNLNRSKYLGKYSQSLPFIILLYLIILFILLIYYGNLEIIIFSLVLLSLGFGYSIFLKKITKSIVAFKSLFVSFLWSLLIVFLTFYYSIDFNFFLYLLITFIFLRRLITTSFCDIKDLKKDEEEKMLTLPVVLSKKNFIYFLNFTNVISVFLLLIGTLFGLYTEFGYFLSVTFLIPLIYINFIDYTKKDINFISEVVVRGEYLLWPIFFLISKTIFNL